jgi:feruloyl esterase
VLTLLSLSGYGDNNLNLQAATPLSCAQLAGKTVPATSIGFYPPPAQR